MAYTLGFTANFGSFTGLTLNAKLYDDAGVQTGATITTGFIEIGNGVYSYKHTTIPDGHIGTFVIYKSTDATVKVAFSVNPQEAEYTDAKTSAVKAKTDNLPVAPASTTNITAGTITTATNVTTVNGLAAGVITATSIAADAITAAKIAANAIDADALATDAVAEMQAGLATATALSTVASSVATILADVISILAQTGTDGVVLSTAVKQAIADEVLKRGMSHVDSATPDTLSLYDLIASLLNGSMLGGVWTAHKSTNATFTTHNLTTDPAALPVTGVSN